MEEIYISRLELQRWFLIVFKNIYLEFGIEVWLILWDQIQISFVSDEFSRYIEYSQLWTIRIPFENM